MDIFLEYLKIFAAGGLFCLAAQLVIDLTRLTPARILVGYVAAGVLLTALGIYEPLLKFAKSGASVPLTGFGYLLASGVKEAVDEKGLLGALTGGLSAASAGIAGVVVLGVLCSLFFAAKEK